MKKTLAIFLALIMILSVALVACKSKTTSSNTNEEEESNEFVVQNKNDTSDTSDGTDDEGNNTVEWITNGIPSTVYTMANVNIRSEANDKSSSVIATVTLGTPLQVVAQSSEKDAYDVAKWYKVSYEGVERYVSGAWVSSNVNDTKFVDCTPEKLVIKDSGIANSPYQVNLRSLPAVTTSTVVKTLTHKEATSNGELTKIAASESGLWFKVKYDVNGDGDTDDAEDIGYIKMTSTIREYFGLATSSGSTGNG